MTSATPVCLFSMSFVPLIIILLLYPYQYLENNENNCRLPLTLGTPSTANLSQPRVFVEPQR